LEGDEEEEMELEVVEDKVFIDVDYI